jgi:phenylacetate-CoA ligase
MRVTTCGDYALSLSEIFVRGIGNRIWLTYKGEYSILKWQRRFAPLWMADDETLANTRLRSLKAIITHANETTAYYSQLFRQLSFDPRGLTSCNELRQLPFLTKEELNRNVDIFLSNAYMKADLVCSSTGGSSGLPLTFYRDKAAQAVRRAQDYLFNAKLGIYPGTKRAWVWGARIDAFSMRSLKAKLANFLTERAIYFFAFDATRENMDEFLKRLQQHRPEAVFAYPNMLAALAKRARETNLVVQPISKVIVTAEPLYNWQRELFRQVFSAETFERYGAREIGTVASECNQHCGMHIFEPSYCFEVVDEAGNNVPNGQMGELVVTDLFNYAMPLVRYRTGDMVVLDDSPCGCGRTWCRIVGIGGRVVDMIVRPDGSKVEGLVVVNSLHVSGVRVKVQVVQTTPTSMIVKHLETDTIPEDVRCRFQERIGEALGASLEIVYEPVPQLRYDPSGKYRYVICECS